MNYTLRYTKKFHDGLRFGIAGNAAGIYSPEQLGAERDIFLPLTDIDIVVCICYRAYDATYSIIISNNDWGLSSSLDSGKIMSLSGEELAEINESECDSLKRESIVSGFKIVHNDMEISVVEP